MTNAWLCLSLIVMYTAIGTGEGSAFERRYPSIPILIPLSLATVMLSYYIGVKIYFHLYAPYLLASTGRDYKDVPPTAVTAEFADAGIIRFTEDATLDTSRSFGYKADDFTYCVAPVVSRNAVIHPDSAGPKVTFWAVGKDCCGNRRDFECDGAGTNEVRSAFTVRDIEGDFITKRLVPRTSRPLYMLAVDAAKALHNLKSESDDNIVLVRWAADPEDTLEVWNGRAKIAVLVSCILYSVLVTMVWTTVHISFQAHVHQLVRTSMGGKGGGAQNRGGWSLSGLGP